MPVQTHRDNWEESWHGRASPWNGSAFGMAWHDDRPGNLEIYFNEVRCCADADLDTFTVCNDDCNDNDDLVFPGATEVCDFVDNDCDHSVDEGFLPPESVRQFRSEIGRETVMWDLVAADRFDIVRGDLTALRLHLGNFFEASIECVIEDAAGEMAT